MQMTVESMADIEAEIRARAKAWNEPTLAQYDERLADRIHAAHERVRHALRSVLAVAAEMREDYEVADRILKDGWAAQLESIAETALR